MAKDWAAGNTLLDIKTHLDQIAPDNTATIPIAMAFENGIWYIDIMVKRPQCEYDVHAEDRDLRLALRGAWMRLGNWRLLERDPDYYDDECPTN